MSVSPFSREEWEWLQKMASMEEPVPAEPEAETSQNHLFQELQVAVKELMTLVNIPLQEVGAGAEVWGGEETMKLSAGHRSRPVPQPLGILGEPEASVRF